MLFIVCVDRHWMPHTWLWQRHLCVTTWCLVNVEIINHFDYKMSGKFIVNFPQGQLLRDFYFYYFFLNVMIAFSKNTFPDECMVYLSMIFFLFYNLNYCYCLIHMLIFKLFLFNNDDHYVDIRTFMYNSAKFSSSYVRHLKCCSF